MKLRLGYVAMTLNLADSSPSGAVTYKTYLSLSDEEARLRRLRKVTNKNLDNTRRILLYNKAMGIPVYRFSSKLVPLATHPDLQGWDYTGDFNELLGEIGRVVKENMFRVSAHPDHFTVINSPLSKVFENSLRDLDYHVRLFEAMGLEDHRYKLVLHVGGVYGNKKDSTERFCENFVKLPDRIRKRLIIENDDRSYNTFEVLEICKRLGVPMVLDVHHHRCLCGEEELGPVLEDIYDTWKGEAFPPKVHFSSPRSARDYRSHADFIDYAEFMDFISITAKCVRDIDVILEAKSKDMALLKLSGELSSTDGIKYLNHGEYIL